MALNMDGSSPDTSHSYSLFCQQQGSPTQNIFTQRSRDPTQMQQEGEQRQANMRPTPRTRTHTHTHTRTQPLSHQRSRLCLHCLVSFFSSVLLRLCLSSFGNVERWECHRSFSTGAFLQTQPASGHVSIFLHKQRSPSLSHTLSHTRWRALSLLFLQQQPEP